VTSSEPTRRPTRRNPVRGRSAAAAAGIAVVAGVGCAFFGLSPTGQRAVDALLVAAAVATMVWAAASAPWWLLAVVAAVAAAFGDGAVFVVLGVVGMLAAVAIGAQRAN
jgi:hypothetical protein